MRGDGFLIYYNFSVNFVACITCIYLCSVAFSCVQLGSHELTLIFPSLVFQKFDLKKLSFFVQQLRVVGLLEFDKLSIEYNATLVPVSSKLF